MSPVANDLFLAVTTGDGTVYTTDRAAGSGAWSAFQSIPVLTQSGRKNLAVTVTPRRQVCAINNAAVRQLRYTRDSGSWSAPVRLATGVAPASINVGDGSFSLAALAIGPPTQKEDWSFGLHLFLLASNETTVQNLGDQTAGIAAGDLTPSDLAVALDILGTFNDQEKAFHLCITTRSGKSFYTYKDGGRPARFELIPFIARGEGRSLSCAPGREGLHICVAMSTGKIHHIIRRADGSWSGVGDVSAATRSSELFQQVAIAHYDAPGQGGVLHVAGITRTGGLFHAMRTAEETADPLWSPFIDVKAAAGDKGAVTSVDVGVTP
jgi:hypothetical protein